MDYYHGIPFNVVMIRVVVVFVVVVEVVAAVVVQRIFLDYSCSSSSPLFTSAFGLSVWFPVT